MARHASVLSWAAMSAMTAFSGAYGGLDTNCQARMISFMRRARASRRGSQGAVELTDAAGRHPGRRQPSSGRRRRARDDKPVDPKLSNLLRTSASDQLVELAWIG
ncbi:hypothetical protein GCM10009745_63520 [Kribbella yunnanensis]|uniref:Secreted protein n=1 Tax=Kribbella yunnanensis TaxID=190194 RepID=A0ABP4UQE9_9ACTN